MSKVATLDYAALDLNGDNYLKWALDTKIMLNLNGDCIVDGNNESMRNLQDQYLTVENPLELWKELNKRYDHQRTVVFPKAKYDWLNLRFMDFKSVDEYNSSLFKIVSKMKLCGETITEKDMLEKTFSTFHWSNILLQQQYRERGFATYSDLIACLLLAEQNNKLVQANSDMRPAGTAPLPEANMAANNKSGSEANYVHRHGMDGVRGEDVVNLTTSPIVVIMVLTAVTAEGTVVIAMTAETSPDPNPERLKPFAIDAEWTTIGKSLAGLPNIFANSTKRA